MWKHGSFAVSQKNVFTTLWITLTHWSRVTHICISKLNIINLDNGFSCGHHQAIILISAGILLIWPLGTNFSEILIEIHTFSFKKMHLKMSSAKQWPFCLSLNVLSMSITMWPTAAKTSDDPDNIFMCQWRTVHFNSLAYGRFEWNFR